MSHARNQENFSLSEKSRHWAQGWQILDAVAKISKHKKQDKRP